jgi:predicted RNase H-like HicB family nuclease
MQNRFTAIFEQTDNWWIAYVQELPGANTQGKTLEEARANLKEAIVLLLEANWNSSSKCRKGRDNPS